jgi:drug/metabolite transporter (DMT)-like permease
VPIGVGLGVALLDESLSRTAWAGLVCVLIGVAAMTLPARTAAKVGARS